MQQSNLQHMSIEHCLTDEINAMSELASLLKKEQLALANNDIDALDKTTSSKTELLRTIAELEKIRTNKVAALGFNGKPDGMHKYFAHNPVETKTCSDLWEKLLRISEQAKEDNRTNGLLINRRLSQNQAALNVLGRGSSSGALYGPTGQTMNTTSMKGLIPR